MAFSDAAPILGDLLKPDAAELEQAAAAGVVECWRVDDCVMATRIENSPDKRELVICALRGRHLERVIPLLVQAALAAGCASIRWHTQRPGLARIAARCGYQAPEVERVHRVELEQKQ